MGRMGEERTPLWVLCQRVDVSTCQLSDKRPMSWPICWMVWISREHVKNKPLIKMDREEFLSYLRTLKSDVAIG